MPDRNLAFEFEVGESERHSVAFLFTSKHSRHYEFSVGSSEPHDVRIEKTRKALMGASRLRSAWPTSTAGRRRATPTPPAGGVRESAPTLRAVRARRVGRPRSAPGPDRWSLFEERTDALAGVL